jgi:hypothetical protein
MVLDGSIFSECVPNRKILSPNCYGEEIHQSSDNFISPKFHSCSQLSSFLKDNANFFALISKECHGTKGVNADFKHKLGASVGAVGTAVGSLFYATLEKEVEAWESTKFDLDPFG